MRKIWKILVNEQTLFQLLDVWGPWRSLSAISLENGLNPEIFHSAGDVCVNAAQPVFLQIFKSLLIIEINLCLLPGSRGKAAWVKISSQYHAMPLILLPAVGVFWTCCCSCGVTAAGFAEMFVNRWAGCECGIWSTWLYGGGPLPCSCFNERRKSSFPASGSSLWMHLLMLPSLDHDVPK